jgi:DNA repair exonuclease SbcCD nuclease subunit
LSAKGYDYWALGHVHEHAILQKAPCWVVFPGNLQGRHIRETGPRGAVLVTADETGILSVERLFVDVLRWHHVIVDVSSAQTLADVVQLAGKALERLVSENLESKPMSARVTVMGRTIAHGDLFSMEAHLRAEILGQAAAVGIHKLWVEKVRVETTPAADPNDIKARADAIADLQALLEEAPKDELLLLNLAEELQQLVGKAPFELMDAVQDFKSIRAGDVVQLVKSVSPSLIAHLVKAS